MPTSIHSFQVKSIDESQVIDFAEFSGKKIMIVNVASACGYTIQYQQLQELYETFGEKLVIVGLPCNDFGGQEPDTDENIKNFCSVRFGVTFPLTTKIVIKGENIHPIYAWLTQKSQNGVTDSDVKWNFQKYLLDEKGHLQKVCASSVTPLDAEILDWVNS